MCSMGTLVDSVDEVFIVGVVVCIDPEGRRPLRTRQLVPMMLRRLGILSILLSIGILFLSFCVLG